MGSIRRTVPAEVEAGVAAGLTYELGPDGWKARPVYHAELNMSEARRRVVLSTLGDVRDGDVFYTVIQPGIVWRRNKAGSPGFEFQSLGTEQWYEQEQLGAPRERVIIIHNTKESST